MHRRRLIGGKGGTCLCTFQGTEAFIWFCLCTFEPEASTYHCQNVISRIILHVIFFVYYFNCIRLSCNIFRQCTWLCQGRIQSHDGGANGRTIFMTINSEEQGNSVRKNLLVKEKNYWGGVFVPLYPEVKVGAYGSRNWIWSYKIVTCHILVRVELLMASDKISSYEIFSKL